MTTKHSEQSWETPKTVSMVIDNGVYFWPHVCIVFDTSLLPSQAYSTVAYNIWLGGKMVLNRTFWVTYLQIKYSEINMKITSFPSISQWQTTRCSRLTKDKTTLQFSVNHSSSAKATTKIKLKSGIKGPTRTNDTADISLRALREETLVYGPEIAFIMLETGGKNRCI